MIKKISSCNQLRLLLIVCKFCNFNRKQYITHCLINTLFNIRCNKLAKYVTRIEAIDIITLSIVKTVSKKNKSTSNATNIER